MKKSKKSSKNKKDGVLVRLITGLTLGPKIAVEDSRSNFLGFFSFEELFEYAGNPAECRRKWRERREERMRLLEGSGEVQEWRQLNDEELEI
jgi:hypothetical protein